MTTKDYGCPEHGIGVKERGNDCAICGVKLEKALESNPKIEKQVGPTGRLNAKD